MRMETHTIKWGKTGLGRSLKEKLLERIDLKAEYSNVFDICVWPEEVHFLRNILKNAYIIERPKHSSGKVWLIIGADEETAKFEYNRT